MDECPVAYEAANDNHACMVHGRTNSAQCQRRSYVIDTGHKALMPGVNGSSGGVEVTVANTGA